jgi:hypothetical protein
MALREITQSRLILCEGPADAAFFRALIATRALPQFNVFSVADHGGVGGVTGFRTALDGITAYRGFENLQHIVIAIDTDTDLRSNFNNVCTQIEAAAPFGTPPVRYQAPAEPLARSASLPTISVMQLPWENELGDLECLLLPAASATWPVIAGCVGTFANCTGSDAWAELQLKTKMKLRSLLAAAHRQNPSIGLGKLWADAPQLIPLAHARFDRVSNYLSTY